ncbi:ribosomal protein S6 kinase [Achlya hypogyna]|uniref:Ribosomal protein S6 kinase n=1 Tax=Achlya hypogyna TaxID=1202772 RepID=A0A1V9YEL9_ACHHY|nr:ribosomal protein S6 kinase [Achlya hypogyna]
MLRGTLLARSSDGRAWRPHVFELDPHLLIRSLRYADVNGKALGQVILTDRDPWIRIQPPSLRPHCFLLKTTDQRMLLAATSDDAMWRWIDFLLQHQCASLADEDDMTRQSLVVHEHDVLLRQSSSSSLTSSLEMHRESTLDRAHVQLVPPDSELWDLGAAIADLMVERLGMLRIALPHEDALSQCHVYVSENWQRASKLLLLVGSSNGRIPPGIWSRHDVTTLGVERGSMLPYLARAQANGFGTLVLDACTNSNLCSNGVTTFKVPVKGSETPMAHVRFVWTQLLPATQARDVVAIAHGSGGAVLHDFLQAHPPALASLRAVAFLDSIHKPTDDVVGRFLRARAVGWERSVSVPSGQPLVPVAPLRRSDLFDAPVAGWRLSSGPVESPTALVALDAVFRFLEFGLDVNDDDESPGAVSDRWMAMQTRAPPY